MAKPVGKLKKINLSEVWGSEIEGFTSWLQQEEILEMLGEALDISLKPAGGDIPLNTLVGPTLGLISFRAGRSTAMSTRVLVKISRRNN